MGIFKNAYNNIKKGIEERKQIELEVKDMPNEELKVLATEKGGLYYKIYMNRINAEKERRIRLELVDISTKELKRKAESEGGLYYDEYMRRKNKGKDQPLF